MNTINRYCVELFRCVIAKESEEGYHIDPHHGVIIRPEAIWAKNDIISFYFDQAMNVPEFNKSFHKSWKKVEETIGTQLALEQLLHYVTNRPFESTNIFIPDEVLFLSNKEHLNFDFIRGISVKTLLNKVYGALNGAALEQATIEKLLAIYDAYGDLADLDRILNKEAVCILADKYGIIPRRPEEVLRLAVYKATGSTLLIKNDEVISAIKASDYNPAKLFYAATLPAMSRVFYRFKPLFLAFKPKCGAIINKIRRCAKTNHKPVSTNPLDMVMWGLLKEEHITDSTPMAVLLRCYIVTSLPDTQTVRLYRVRNGKSFVKQQRTNRYSPIIVEHNRKLLIKVIKQRLSKLQDKTVILPDNVSLGIPTSAKKFLGHLPEGSFIEGNTPMIGVYWRNEWGANDLDISAINLKGDVFSWQGELRGDVTYSGDMTDATDGASEFLKFNNVTEPFIIQNNVYNGDPMCEYNIILGNRESYNTDAQNVIEGEELITAQHLKGIGIQSTLGICTPYENTTRIYLTRAQIGRSIVAQRNEITNNALTALTNYFKEIPTLMDLLDDIGVKYVKKSSLEQKRGTIDMSNPTKLELLELLNL